MAFGKGKGGKNPNRKFFNFKLRTKDLPAPIFEVTTKNKETGKYDVVDSAATNVSGNLVGVTHKTFNYQGSDIHSEDVVLEDGDDLYYVNIPYGYLGRALFNRLLSLTTFDNIEIGVYQTKPREDNNKTFGAASLRQNDVIVKWKFENDKVPKTVKTKFKGKDLTDTTDLDAFFAEQLAELDKSIKASPRGIPATSSKFKNDSTPENNDIPDDAAVNGGQEDDASELPF